MISDLLITVIVPIFNTEQYLHKCLDSICDQTYSNIEIILVNDGSTDKSGIICEEYSVKDKRITVFHKTNGGLTSSRKAGIAEATGTYVCFVDSDDWIDPMMIEHLVNAAKNNNYPDMISFGGVEEYSDRSVTINNKLEHKLYINENIEELKNRMLMSDVFWEWRVLPHIWNKMIKIDLIKKSLEDVSDKIEFGEDVANVFPCLLSSDSFLSFNYTPYHYRQREGSIVKSNAEQKTENFTEIYALLKRKFIGRESLEEQLKFYMFFILMLKSYSRLKYNMPLFPFRSVEPKSKILLYAAGGFGKVIYNYISNSSDLTLAGWTDKNYSALKKGGLPVDNTSIITERDYDHIVIAILNEKIAVKIKEDLISKGVPEEKIDYVRTEYISCLDLPDWLI